MNCGKCSWRRENDWLRPSYESVEMHCGDGGDRLSGTHQNDELYGEGGLDGIQGHNGNDLLDGRDGRPLNDRLNGDQGQDRCLGDPDIYESSETVEYPLNCHDK